MAIWAGNFPVVPPECAGIEGDQKYLVVLIPSRLVVEAVRSTFSWAVLSYQGISFAPSGLCVANYKLFVGGKTCCDQFGASGH